MRKDGANRKDPDDSSSEDVTQVEPSSSQSNNEITLLLVN